MTTTTTKISEAITDLKASIRTYALMETLCREDGEEYPADIYGLVREDAERTLTLLEGAIDD